MGKRKRRAKKATQIAFVPLPLPAADQDTLRLRAWIEEQLLPAFQVPVSLIYSGSYTPQYEGRTK